MKGKGADGGHALWCTQHIDQTCQLPARGCGIDSIASVLFSCKGEDSLHTVTPGVECSQQEVTLEVLLFLKPSRKTAILS